MPVATAWPSVNGRNEVLLADLDRIHLQLRRDEVDQPLDHEGRLGPPGAAVGVRRRRVREDAVDDLADVRDVVRARQHQAVQDRRNAGRGGREVRAHVGPHGRADADDRAVLLRGHLDVLDVIAAVDRAAVVLGPRLGPLDRAAALLRREDHHRVLGIVRDLAAEAAAHLGRDDADLVLGDAGVEREQEADDVRVLGRHPERDLAGRRPVLGERRARLHRVRNQALVDDPLGDDHVGRLEGGIHVAALDLPREGEVVRHVRRGAAGVPSRSPSSASTTTGSGS